MTRTTLPSDRRSREGKVTIAVFPPADPHQGPGPSATTLVSQRASEPEVSLFDQAQPLRQLAGRILPQLRDASHRSCRVILWMGAAARVGTTTLTLHTALALARHQLPVALVDGHPSDNALSRQAAGAVRHSLLDVLAGRRSIHEICHPAIGGVRLAANGPQGLAAGIMGAAATRRLVSAVEQLAATHWVLADLGWGPNPVLAALACAADHLVLVLTPHTETRVQGYQLIKSLAGTGTAARLAAVMNRPQPCPHPDAGLRLLVATCREFLNLHVDSLGTVDHDADLAKAAAEGQRGVAAARRATFTACSTSTFVPYFVTPRSPAPRSVHGPRPTCR